MTHSKKITTELENKKQPKKKELPNRKSNIIQRTTLQFQNNHNEWWYIQTNR